MDSLSRIAIFIAVAKAESFTGAARELGLTSSAVSKQIQNLEYELKVKLLNRTTRRVSLTEEGSLFYERASRALEDIAEAREELNDLKATPRGSLKISVPNALGDLYLKTPIAEFAALYPDVQLDVQFDDKLVSLTEDGFDLVIRLGTLSDSSMIARKLVACPITMCASPAYLARYGTPQTAEDLKNHHVLAYTRNKGALEWRYRDPDGSEGIIPLQSAFKCDSASMMSEAAKAGLGIIIAPSFLFCHEIIGKELIPILPNYQTMPERNLYAIFPPNRYLSTRLRLFVDYIDAYCTRVLAPLMQQV
ncbi:MAG: LysR family transcriptional regulator [Pseudobdellovibrionaceae bacterium]